MTTGWRSSLLVGGVMHQRLAPMPHAFRYAINMYRLDLDELADLDRGLRLFGLDRWRPVAFHHTDHLKANAQALRARLDARLRAEGVTASIERVELITQCRVFGYVFNPVSFFLCYAAADALVAIVAEVHNTFGDQHCYVLAAQEEHPGAAPRVWHDKKVLHVSPFLTLHGTYRFQFSVAESHVDIRIDLHRDGEPVFVSRLSLDRRPLSDAALARVLIRYPLMTVRVVVAIHWQALRLWLKGVAYVPRPSDDPTLARANTDA